MWSLKYSRALRVIQFASFVLGTKWNKNLENPSWRCDLNFTSRWFDNEEREGWIWPLNLSHKWDTSLTRTVSMFLRHWLYQQGEPAIGLQWCLRTSIIRLSRWSKGRQDTGLQSLKAWLVCGQLRNGKESRIAKFQQVSRPFLKLLEGKHRLRGLYDKALMC